MKYRIEYLVIVDHEDGLERDARTGWLILDNVDSDAEARTYADWNDDGLVDCDFLDPGDHFPSASNRNVMGGQGPTLTGTETFFSAVVTKVERITPVQIGSDARFLEAIDL